MVKDNWNGFISFFVIQEYTILYRFIQVRINLTNQYMHVIWNRKTRCNIHLSMEAHLVPGKRNLNPKYLESILVIAINKCISCNDFSNCW